MSSRGMKDCGDASFGQASVNGVFSLPLRSTGDASLMVNVVPCDAVIATCCVRPAHSKYQVVIEGLTQHF